MQIFLFARLLLILILFGTNLSNSLKVTEYSEENKMELEAKVLKFLRNRPYELKGGKISPLYNPEKFPFLYLQLENKWNICADVFAQAFSKTRINDQDLRDEDLIISGSVTNIDQLPIGKRTLRVFCCGIQDFPKYYLSDAGANSLFIFRQQFENTFLFPCAYVEEIDDFSAAAYLPSMPIALDSDDEDACHYDDESNDNDIYDDYDDYDQPDGDSVFTNIDESTSRENEGENAPYEYGRKRKVHRQGCRNSRRPVYKIKQKSSSFSRSFSIKARDDIVLV